MLRQGEDYSDLKKAFIIFICVKDPFKAGIPKYTFNYVCNEVKDLRLGDDATVVVINAESKELAGMTPEFRQLVSYIAGNAPTGTLSEEIEVQVADAKLNGLWKEEFMTYQEHLKMAEMHGLRKGFKEAKKEQMQSLMTSIRKMHRDGFSAAQIADYLNLEEDFVQNMIVNLPVEEVTTNL